MPTTIAPHQAHASYQPYALDAASGELTPTRGGWWFTARAGGYALHRFIQRPRYMTPDAEGGFRLYAHRLAWSELQALATLAGVPVGRLRIPPRPAAS